MGSLGIIGGINDGFLIGILFEILLRQAQGQLTVLKIEELTATVRGAHHEVVETLVILHQVRLNKLMHCFILLILQELLCVITRLHQGNVLLKCTKLQTLWGKDARTQLSGHVGLAVLIERHQLVHTEDIDLHIHLRAVHLMLQLRVQLIHIAVLGDIVLSLVLQRSGGIRYAVYLQDIHCYLPLKQ